MVEILLHTPKWVFGLFIFLVALGIQQSRNRVVKPFMIFLLPASMVVLSYFSVISTFGLSLILMGLWLGALLSIAYLTMRYFPVKGVGFDLESERFSIPGSWVSFILMMMIFFAKYCINAVLAINPSVIGNTLFSLVCSFCYGAISGIFMARMLSIWRVRKLTAANN